MAAAVRELNAFRDDALTKKKKGLIIVLDLWSIFDYETLNSFQRTLLGINSMSTN